jgi:hypothetical protein
MYLSTPNLGVDKVSEYWWQLVIAISDQGDSLTICEQLSQGYNCSHCHVTFKVVLRFLYNFIDMIVLPLVMGLGDCAQKHSLAHGTVLLQPLRLFGLLLSWLEELLLGVLITELYAYSIFEFLNCMHGESMLR